MSINFKDVGIRALKTFVQAAISYLMAALAGKDLFAATNDKVFWAGLIVSAGAAGVSAVWNAVLNPIYNKVE